MNKYTLKKQQKWAALLVTVTFAWLLHVTAIPLAADDNTEPSGAAVIEQSNQPDVEQAPGFVEQEGPEPAHRDKVTTLLIIVGVVLLAFLIGDLIDTGA